MPGVRFSVVEQPPQGDVDQAAAVFSAQVDAPDQLAQVVSEEVGEDVAVLDLYSGALGEPGSGADSYIGMMETNLRTILEGLGE